MANVVVDAIVEQYTDPGEDARDTLLMITTRPALRDAFVDAAATIQPPLAEAIADRLDGTDGYAAQVLAASVAAAVQVALERWVRPAGTSSAKGGLVVPSGSLPELIRAAFAPLRPALDAAGKRRRR